LTCCRRRAKVKTQKEIDMYRKEYTEKLMEIYDLKTQILSEYDRWETFMNYPDEETKIKIDKTIEQLKACRDMLYS